MVYSHSGHGFLLTLTMNKPFSAPAKIEISKSTVRSGWEMPDVWLSVTVKLLLALYEWNVLLPVIISSIDQLKAAADLSLSFNCDTDTFAMTEQYTS